jgi:hypothetical protein
MGCEIKIISPDNDNLQLKETRRVKFFEIKTIQFVRRIQGKAKLKLTRTLGS